MLTNEPQWFDVPHEPGERFALNTLSWSQLRTARKYMDAENRDVIKDLGAEFMAAMRDPDAEKRVREITKKQQYAENNFDTQYILKVGIADWSYSNGSGEKAPLTKENLDLLDERTAMWAKQKIIDITRPPDEEEEKNSSGGSTAT